MQNTHKDLQDSGLHNTPFFTRKYISCDKIGMEIDNIEWNRELHRKYSIDEDDLTELSEDEIDERVREDFYQDAFIYNYYRQVEEYNVVCPNSSGGYTVIRNIETLELAQEIVQKLSWSFSTCKTIKVKN